MGRFFYTLPMAKTNPLTPPKPRTTSVIAHSVALAHPEDLPLILTSMECEGWQLLHIVPCRHSNEHAAYFRKV